MSDADEDEECPICCINFPAFNYYACCGKPICTECYVHLISSTSAMEVPCPYCKSEKNSIKVRARAHRAGACASSVGKLARDVQVAARDLAPDLHRAITAFGACSLRSRTRLRSCARGARRQQPRRPCIWPSRCDPAPATLRGARARPACAPPFKLLSPLAGLMLRSPCRDTALT